eukprot:scaffold627_cov125-Cylindrotheca_fusiformis.AAC.26
MGSKRKIEKTAENKAKKSKKTTSSNSDDPTMGTRALTFDYRYIVAPMVGASELPFRLLCRKYGAQLVYTPMMIAEQFATSKEYREQEFQTCSFDRPLVCHFAANNPKAFAKAAKKAAPFCDAIDLNLGCPQRTAYVGHFGSYLLEDKDRALVLDIVKTGVAAVNIPIFVKIRLLETFEDTVQLCRQLYEAGASLIAVHGRYRATFHRKGPGARDGPALLDQIQKLKEAFPHQVLITNGNTITYEDVENNLESTKADGIMSAEGILDNPALFLGRLGSRNERELSVVVRRGGRLTQSSQKEMEKLRRKLHKIKKLQSKMDAGKELSEKDQSKILKVSKLKSKLKNIEEAASQSLDANNTTKMTLGELYDASDDKVSLALEYIQLVQQYPATLRTVIFHTRRILKQELGSYQLMEECLNCKSVDAVEALIRKIRGYQKDPGSFIFDVEKAKKEKETLERKKAEEGKRKNYESRMIRKAKREGKADLDYYLRQGAVVPTAETIEELKNLSKEDQMKLWKEREHTQHCLAFHLNGGCPRGRGCAFLHAASKTTTTFDEQDEVAG